MAIKTVVDEDELMLISNKGKIIRLRAADIPVQGRSTQGVRLINLEEGERRRRRRKVSRKGMRRDKRPPGVIKKIVKKKT